MEEVFVSEYRRMVEESAAIRLKTTNHHAKLMAYQEQEEQLGQPDAAGLLPHHLFDFPGLVPVCRTIVSAGFVSGDERRFVVLHHEVLDVGRRTGR